MELQGLKILEKSQIQTDSPFQKRIEKQREEK
jgi:hypothetical protein